MADLTDLTAAQTVKLVGASLTGVENNAVTADANGNLGTTNPSVSLTGAAPAASATLVAGSVTTAAPTYTTGQMSALSLTATGGLRIDGSGSGNIPINITQFAGAAPSATNPSPNRLTDGTSFYDARQTRALTIADVVTGVLKDSSGNEIVTIDMDNTGAVAKVLGVSLRTIANGTTQEVGVVASPMFVQTKTPTTAASPGSASVGITSASIVAANSARKGLRIMNLSTNVVSLGISTAAILNSGITLLGPGGVWNMDEYDFTTGQIFAIASLAASAISIQEFS